MQTTIPRSFVTPLLAALMLATPALPVLAEGSDSPKIKAKGQLEEGARLFEQGDYESALSRFKTAYDLYPSPKIQFNFGQAYRALGRNDEAIVAFKRFLNEAQDASSAFRTEAQQYIQELKLSTLSLNGTRPPLPSPQSQSTALPAASSLTATSRARRSYRTYFWAGAAATAAFGLAAAVSWSTATGRFDDHQSSCGRTTSGCTDGQISPVKSRVLLTNVFWSFAGTAAVAAGFVFYLDHREPSISVALRF